jgi:hypothetical protein
LNHLIVQAIHQKRFLKLRYYGYFRVVEPHAYGLDSVGDAVLICYQVAGEGLSGAATGWKRLKLYEAVSVTETNETFSGARAGYAPEELAFHAVFAQL